MALKYRLERITRLRKDKEKREARRIPQQEVADAVGVHVNTIWRFENGQYTDPEPGIIEKIAAYFAVPYGYFMEEVDDNSEPMRPKKRNRSGYTMRNRIALS